jgi:hypothetical protein
MFPNSLAIGMAVPKTSRRGVAAGRPNPTIGTRVAIACDHTAVGPHLQDVAIAPAPEARRRSSATSRSPAVQPNDPRCFLCRLCSCSQYCLGASSQTEAGSPDRHTYRV